MAVDTIANDIDGTYAPPIEFVDRKLPAIMRDGHVTASELDALIAKAKSSPRAAPEIVARLATQRIDDARDSGQVKVESAAERFLELWR